MLYAIVQRIWVAVMNCLTRLLGIDRKLEAITQTQIEQNIVLSKILAAVTPLPAVKLLFTVELEGQIIEGATHLDIRRRAG